jgi:hypothetical protein
MTSNATNVTEGISDRWNWEELQGLLDTYCEGGNFSANVTNGALEKSLIEMLDLPWQNWLNESD